MAKTLQLLLILFVCVIQCKPVFSQEIANVEIIPENPTNADEILLIVSTSFPLLECSLDSVHSNYACNAFSFDAFYSTEFSLGDCNRTDTLSLGVLNNGLYLITYRMYYFGWSEVDRLDTAITIGTTGIPGSEQDNEKILSIWPNPANGDINIKADPVSVDQLSITSASGSLVKNFDLRTEKAHSHITRQFPAGLYICTALYQGRPVTSKRFIVLDD